MKKPRILVGSSTEAIRIAKALTLLLKDAGSISLWTHGQQVFTLTHGTLESLVRNSEQFDFAILILSPDDLLTIRNQQQHVPRHNVIFELGLFIARLGIDRTFILCDEAVVGSLPSDLAGITVATYKIESAESDLLSALQPSCFLIEQSIRTLGQRKITYTQRISIIGSTTHEIETSKNKTKALTLFYRTLLDEVERASIGINTCGPSPFREAIFSYFCDRIRNGSRTDVERIRDMVRWYWRKGGKVGINIEPPIFENYEGRDQLDRRIKEISDASVIVALGGRTGTRVTIEQILDYHVKRLHGINLSQKPFIILGWIGGASKELLDADQNRLSFLLRNYADLRPTEYVPNWYEGDNPILLARRLVAAVQRLLFLM
jgi:hypothetical protein